MLALPSSKIMKREVNTSKYSIFLPHLFIKLKASIECCLISHDSSKKTTNSDFFSLVLSLRSSILTSSDSVSSNSSSYFKFSWPSTSESKSQLVAVAGFMFLKYGGAVVISGGWHRARFPIGTSTYDKFHHDFPLELKNDFNMDISVLIAGGKAD